MASLASREWAQRFALLIRGAKRERSEAQRMEKRKRTDELARILCRELYEFTDGWPSEWRRTVGGVSLHAAVEHAVQHGWLLIDDQDCSICLTEKGRRLVRKMLS